MNAMIATKSSLTGKFLGWHTWVLLGYALLGRGFSYIGVAPLYVGEVTLMYGFLALIFNRSTAYFFNDRLLNLLRVPAALILVVFIGWCLIFCTLPYIPIYNLDAIRDSATWYYSLFALIVALFLINQPQHFYLLLSRYRQFILVFLCLTPVLWLITNLNIAPVLPGAKAAIVESKIADVMVHLSGCLAFAVSFRLPQVWLLSGLFLVNIAAVGYGTNRSGAVAFTIAASLIMLFYPRSKKVWAVLGAIVLALGLVLTFYPDAVEPFLRKLGSIISSEGSSARDQGTKEWRLRWWTKIIDYTFHGQYFWTGRGFGINLATADGFDPFNDGNLRSPHNGHMSILARTGVPGFCLWIALHVSWVAGLVAFYVKSLLKQQKVWSSLFIFLIIYWMSFMITTSFEVIIEGPTGGIWIWTIYGVGLAAQWLYPRMPELLDAKADRAVDWDDRATDGVYAPTGEALTDS
jgi:O-antigen ligase